MLSTLIKKSYNFFFRYPAPANLGYSWNFGVCAIVLLIVQIVSGLFLAMHYIPHTDYAFESVDIIMKEVPFGWMIRYLHLNGASFFFACVYAHLLRGLYFMSYDIPRDATWVCGVLLLIVMIITAFTGYVLPWGQMGFWAATVITNLVAVIPFVGDYILVWLWGGYGLNTDTLNRFFAIHYLLPFVILAFVSAHIVFLHEFGSSNPLGYCDTTDKASFHPVYTVKDIFFVAGFILLLSYSLAVAPDAADHPDNSLNANPLVTPAHVVPEWYFLIFYAILRSVPSKLFGVIALVIALITLLIIPFIIGGIHDAHTEYVRAKYRVYPDREKPRYPWWEPMKNPFVEYIRNTKPYINTPYFEKMRLKFEDEYHLALGPAPHITQRLFWLFFINCIILGFVGTRSMETHWLLAGRHLIFNYFLYFFLLMMHFHMVPIKLRMHLREDFGWLLR